MITFFPVTARTAVRPPGTRRHRGLPIVRLLGIPISIDWTWLIIGTIVVVSLFAGFSASNPGSSRSVTWAASLFTAVLFFFSLVVHELSHSVVARARGLDVLGIRLFVFGGVSELKKEPSKASDELLMAVVGPVTSSLLALAFWGVRLGFPPDSLASGVATWIATINLVLAAFNLLPGFPLDGGRILRAILWRATGDFQKASRIATRMGAILAYGLILLGVLLMFGRGEWMNGVWIAFIGWFLLSAAGSSMTQVRIQEALSKRSVSQVMRSDCTTIPPSESVRAFVENRLLRTGEKCFVVGSSERMEGLVTLQDVKRLPRDEWDFTSVDRIMVPVDKVLRIAPAASLLAAMETMNDAGVNQLPILDGDRLIGILTRQDLLRAVAVDLESDKDPVHPGEAP